MQNCERYHRSGSVAGRRSNSQTPATTNSIPFLKPAQLLRDLKLRALSLPQTDFELPESFFAELDREAATKEKEDKKEKAKMLKKIMKNTNMDNDDVASTSHPITSLLKDTITIGNDDITRLTKKHTSMISKDERDKSHYHPLTSMEYKVHPSATIRRPPPFSIISLKHADASLLPPAVKEPLHVKRKKCFLEYIVRKINCTKKEESNSSPSTPSSTPDCSISACSSAQIDLSSIYPEERKKKRKSGEPLKIYSEAEVAAIEQSVKGKIGGRKKKKNAGRKPPPAKRKKVVETIHELKEREEETDELKEVEEETDELYYQPTLISDESGLPPRIIVRGQEPGKVLGWDEEEIIILRDGETPKMRPPIMKRKNAPKVYETLLTSSPMEEETTMMDVALLENELVTSPISLYASQSSDDSMDSLLMPALSRQVSHGDATSPTMSPVIQVLTPVLISNICVPVKKRDSFGSTSSVESNGTGRSKRAIRLRTRFSPTPDDGSTRCFPQMGMNSNGLHINHHISPIQ